MPNEHREIRWIAHAVLLSLLAGLLTGCGSPTGPSADKVRLDLQDKLDSRWFGMIKLKDLQITQRKVLAEDRVKLHIKVHQTLDHDRIQQIQDQENKPGGLIGVDEHYKIERVKQFGDRINHDTIRYKRTAPKTWEITSRRVGYH